MNTRAAYPGTFDPVTFGHVNVIGRASRMFNHVIIAVAASPAKTPLFSLEERIDLVRQVMSEFKNVDVVGFSGLVTDFALENDVGVLVRGVRSLGDLDYEKQMSVMNSRLAPSVDTAMLAPAPEYAHISATLVREIALLGGNVEELVPDVVAHALKKKASQV